MTLRARTYESLWLDLLLGLGVPLLITVGFSLLPVAKYWRASRPPRPGFGLGRYRGRPAFAAPLSPVHSGWLFVWQLSFLGIYAPVDRLNRDVWSDATLRALFVTQVVVGVAVLVLNVLVLFRPPHLRITPDGLIVTTMRSRLVPWDALAPGGPTGNEARRGVLWLQARIGTRGLGSAHAFDLYQRPALPGHAWFRLQLRSTLVDPEYLARALRTYRDNPALRPAAGTAEELTRLHRSAYERIPGLLRVE